ncbi:MAG: TetR/AcrR family transcriptional regulator [Pyrinomonadaceae bacterium]
MGLKERREREKENLRQEILDVARELFVAEGFQNVSMRKIADQIEYSPTTIYLYFKDKNDILMQICEETFALLYRRMQEIEQHSENALECLSKGIKAYVEFGLEHPHHYEVTFIAPIWKDIDKSEEYKYEGSMGERTFGYLRSVIAATVAEGSIKKGDIDAISQTVWAAMHGLTSLLIGHEDFPFVTKEKLIDCLTEMILSGLKS